jgi:hypothetical protein
MNYDPNKIVILDDVVPQWLHDQAINQVLHYPLSFGHRGLGQYQGHQIFSQQFSQAELENTPWTLKAVWHAFEHHKNLIDNDVGDIQLNQVQINLTTKEHTGGLHVDSGDDVPAYTMVYLIHGDTGMDFWDGDPEKDGKKIDEVEYKEGRLIVFPSRYLHRGIPVKDVSPRVTAGYVFSGKSTPFARQRNIILPIFKKEQVNYDSRNNI